MRFLILVFLCLASLSSWSSELSPDEELSLVEIVKGVMTKYESGDFDALAQVTFEPLVAAAGGLSPFKLKLKQAADQYRQNGLVMESMTVGKPTSLTTAGEYELSFVPKITTIRMPGRHGRSTNVMVAVRKVGATEWRLIDGAGLRKNLEILRYFFPSLPANLQLPENKLELLP